MARKPNIPCTGCGKLMWTGRSGATPGKSYCWDCRRAAHTARDELKATAAAERVVTCAFCGIVESIPGGPVNTRYCSGCRERKLRLRICPLCKVPSPLKDGQSRCGRCEYLGLQRSNPRAALVLYKGGHQRAAHRPAKRRVTIVKSPPGRWVSGPCPVCDEWFVGRNVRHAACSEECRRRKLATNHRARARRFGVAYETVNVRKVYDRDGWICGICRESVDPDCKYPHPRSPSLDHVVPMSKGGPHLYSNVQLAHLACNVAKSNRLEPAWAAA